MNGMDIKAWLTLCPKNVAATLRARREDVISEVRGTNVRELSIAYRYAVRAAMAFREPRVEELPAWLRLRVRPGQYHAIREAVLGAIREVADEQLAVPYETTIVHADEDRERGRRVAIYQKRWEAVLARFGDQVDETTVRKGPAATSVWCLEMFKPFDSVRKAAEWLSTLAGRVVCRSEVRKAIKAKTACCGYHFAYGDGAPVIVANGNERRVYCATLDRWFETHREAYEFAGVNKHQFAKAMAKQQAERRGVVVGTLRFKLRGPKNAVVVVRRRVVPPSAYVDRYPLLAYLGVRLDGAPLAMAG